MSTFPHILQDWVPADVIEVCQRLADRGNSVHLVGGAVRDLFLRVPPGDIDIATSATPGEVAAIFEKVVETGVKHGTVTVITDQGTPVEVTTYRVEDGYVDGRHPQKVEFVHGIEQDLGRRDFTVNAIAIAFPHGEIIDPFAGQADLQGRVLRAVGDPTTRFREDGLRLLRACRFCATIEFEIEKSTLEGMAAARDQLASVSAERQRDEIIKVMSARQPSRAFAAARLAGLLQQFLPEIQRCVGFAQNKWHKYDVFEHTMKVLDETEPILDLRLAALFHDAGKPDTATDVDGERHFYNHEKRSSQIAADVLKRLKFPNAVVDTVSQLIAEHMWFYDENWSDAAVRRFVRRIGGEAHIKQTFALRRADIIGRGLPELEQSELELTGKFHGRVQEQIERNTIFSLKNLPIDGRDVMVALEIEPGPKVGQVLRWLLEQLENDPEKNNRDKALELIGIEFKNR